MDQELEQTLPDFLKGHPVSPEIFKTDLRVILYETLDEKKLPDWRNKMDYVASDNIIEFWAQNTELAREKNPVLVCFSFFECCDWMWRIQAKSEYPEKVRVYCQMHSRLYFKTFVELFAGERPCFKSEKIDIFKQRISGIFSGLFIWIFAFFFLTVTLCFFTSNVRFERNKNACTSTRSSSNGFMVKISQFYGRFGKTLQRFIFLGNKISRSFI